MYFIKNFGWLSNNKSIFNFETLEVGALESHTSASNKNTHLCQFRQDGNLPWFLSFFFFFWPVATAKRTELALISQQFLKISARYITRKKI